MSSTESVSRKVLVIGLDGATWDLLGHYMNIGLMPTLKKLIQDGVRGNLESTLPPVTGPAWVSFATGKNPGKHGCFDFLLPKNSLADLRPITSRDIIGKTFYEYINQHGMKNILINLPVSYPPRTEGDIIITSLMTQGDNFVFPENIKNEIDEFKEYRIVPNMSLLVKDKLIEYFKDISKLEEIKYRCAQKLFKKEWDFFFVLFSATDWIQHNIFHKLRGADGEANEAKRIYRQLDDYLNWFVLNMPKDANLLLMSDHGFKTFKGTFHINEWLRKEGYLKTQRSTEAPEAMPNRITKEFSEAKTTPNGYKSSIFVPTGLIKYQPWLKPVYKKIERLLPFKLRSDLERITPRLSESYCVCTTSESNAIYINSRRSYVDDILLSNNEYKQIKKELINKLISIKDPQHNNLFRNVFSRNEVYSGKKLTCAPDILFILNDYTISSKHHYSIFNNMEVNNHDMLGIFSGYGPDFKKGMKLEDVRIYDIAPTILYLLDLPIPSDMDGKVITEALTSQVLNTRTSKIEATETEEADQSDGKISEADEEEVKKRLKDLGYL